MQPSSNGVEFVAEELPTYPHFLHPFALIVVPKLSHLFLNKKRRKYIYKKKGTKYWQNLLNYQVYLMPTSMPCRFLAFGSASTCMYRVPSHGNWTIYSMQFVIESTSVTNHFPLHIPSPNGCGHGTAICTGHIYLFRHITTVLIELLFLVLHLKKKKKKKKKKENISFYHNIFRHHSGRTFPFILFDHAVKSCACSSLDSC